MQDLFYFLCSIIELNMYLFFKCLQAGETQVSGCINKKEELFGKSYVCQLIQEPITANIQRSYVFFYF